MNSLLKAAQIFVSDSKFVKDINKHQFSFSNSHLPHCRLMLVCSNNKTWMVLHGCWWQRNKQRNILSTAETILGYCSVDDDIENKQRNKISWVLQWLHVIKEWLPPCSTSFMAGSNSPCKPPLCGIAKASGQGGVLIQPNTDVVQVVPCPTPSLKSSRQHPCSLTIITCN